MGDIHRVNRQLNIRKYERDKIIQQSNILALEVRILEIEGEIERCKKDVEEFKVKMAALEASGHEAQNKEESPQQKQIVAKKFMRDKLVMLGQAEARDIRAMELLDEIDRCRADIGVHQGEIERLNMNIKQQEELLAQEKAAGSA